MSNIVNKLTVLIFLMLPHISEAKSGTWPGVEYAYVRVYLYNTESNLHAYHAPVKHNNQLDSTILGPGSRLDSAEIGSILKIANRSGNALLVGLTGCYIPHHAFIFFNDDDIPVAYMSYCAECQGIRLWPERSVKTSGLSKRQVRSAEQDSETLSDLLREKHLPVHSHPEDYQIYTGPEEQAKFMIIELDSLVPVLLYGRSLPEIRKNYADPESLKVKEYERITAGGDSYNFTEVLTATDTLHFYGTGSGSAISEGIIHGRSFKLLNGVRVGMSLEQLMKITNNKMTPYSGVTGIEYQHTLSDLTIRVYWGNNHINKILISE